MPTPEVIHSEIHTQKGNLLLEHLRNPAEVVALTAAAYVGIMLGSRLLIPALNNLVEVLQQTLGK